MLPLLFNAIQKSKNILKTKEGVTLKRTVWYTCAFILFMLFGTLIFIGIEVLRTKRVVAPKSVSGFLIKRVLFYTIGVIAFLLFGTMVFSGIEGNALLMRNWKYLEMQDKLEERITEILHLKNLSRHSDNQTAMEEDVKYKIKQLLNVSTVICNIQNEKEWSFHDSLSFAKSVITTIGYGVYYPSTTSSKIVCIIYAILGVPLFLHFLAYIQGAIEFMKDSVINSKILKQKEVAKLTIVVVALVMLLAMLINGSMTRIIQQKTDGFDSSNLNKKTQEVFNTTIKIGSEHKWSYFVCVYFVFESITTLGFGDLYVHGAGGAEAISKDIITLLFVSILIAMFAFFFGLLQDEIESYTLSKIAPKGGQFGDAVQMVLAKERAERFKKNPSFFEASKIKSLEKKNTRAELAAVDVINFNSLSIENESLPEV